MDIIKKELTKKVGHYYFKGLNSREIGKLLDISPRTVQRYLQQTKLKNSVKPKPTRPQKAVEMHVNGWSYAEIAQKMNVCKTTVYLWCKKAKAETVG
jgi:DNA-directed RNA polymerase specialized sigma24 family protein